MPVRVRSFGDLQSSLGFALQKFTFKFTDTDGGKFRKLHILHIKFGIIRFIIYFINVRSLMILCSLCRLRSSRI